MTCKAYVDSRCADQLCFVHFRNISHRANDILTGGSDVSQIAVTFLQIVIRQAPML
jgi:hypothetical protein